MSPQFQILLGALVIFSLGIPQVMRKRGKQKMGCLTHVYISLVVFMVTVGFLALTAIIGKTTISDATTIVNGKSYRATTIGYLEDGDMYTASYSFVDDSGKTILFDSNYSTENQPAIGDTLTLYYDKKEHTFLEIGVSFYIFFLGKIIMWLMLAMAFGGIVSYAMDWNRDKTGEVLGYILLNIFLPLVIVCFEALLIYAFFYGNEMPIGVRILLGFFILILALTIIGGVYAKIGGSREKRNKGTKKKKDSK